VRVENVPVDEYVHVEEIIIVNVIAKITKNRKKLSIFFNIHLRFQENNE